MKCLYSCVFCPSLFFFTTKKNYFMRVPISWRQPNTHKHTQLSRVSHQRFSVFRCVCVLLLTAIYFIRSDAAFSVINL